MAYPPPMNRPSQQQQPYYNPPNDRRAPPPQQYDQGYQQDWQQQGYGGYEDHGHQNGYEQYEGNQYAGEQSYDQGYGYPDGQYDQQSGDYAYEQSGLPSQGQRPPHPPGPQRRPGPRPPPNGTNEPQNPGQRGGVRGPQRYPHDQRPPPQDLGERARSRSRPRPPMPSSDRGNWDTQQPPMPFKAPPRGSSSSGRRNGDVPRDGRGDYRPPAGQAHQRGYSQDQYGPDPGYDRANQGYGDPRQRRPPPRDLEGRNRAPLPDFQSVRHAPRHQRPGTAAEARGPPARPPMPQSSQTQPSTPVGGSFAGDSGGWGASGHPGASFDLPSRPGTAPGPHRGPMQDDEMPAFAQTGKANGNDEATQTYQPLRYQSPAQEELALDMPGTTPAFPLPGPSNNGPSPPPNQGLSRSQTAGPYQPPGPHGRQPLRREMTDGGRNYPEDRRGQLPPNGPPNGYAVGAPSDMDYNSSAYQDQPGGRTPPSGSSRQGLPNGGRSGYNPGSAPGPGPGGYGNGRTPPGPGYPPRDNRNLPRGPPPSGPSPQSQLQSGQSRHGRKNSDALPYHPSPVQNGQRSYGAGDERQKPVPVRNYDTGKSDASSIKSQPTAPPTVTLAELDSLRRDCGRNPSDLKKQFTLAKKLVEASRVLADEGGRADPKTRALNQDRYNKEAYRILKLLVSREYPDAMFYLADCYGEGSLNLANDPKEAFNLYQSAAKLGHAASAYRTAVCCEIGADEGGGTRRDLAKAVQWYKRASSLGDIPATYKMGIISLKGLLGQERSTTEAMGYLRKAAERADEENPHAPHELAALYEAANSPRRDEAEALRLYTQAGKLGYKFSQFRLGQVYENGQLGAAIDSRHSIIWYTKAAAQGEHQSELALSGWYLTGSEGILEHSDTEAYLWARKAANAEPPLPKAMFAMGYFTEVGIGCPRSLEEAKRWYGRAAAQGFPKARERLEELRRGGPNAQKRRERLSRSNQGKNEENCRVM